MTRHLLLRAIAAAAILLSPAVPSAARQAVPPPPPQAPPVPQAGIALFEDVNYGGRRLTFVADQRNLRNTVLDNRTSSLAIAAGEIWEVCDGPDFSGDCQTFTDAEPDLLRLRWNDKISSLRRLRRPAPPRVVDLELFAGTNYTGQRVVLTDDVRDLRGVGFNDRAMSARIRPGGAWELCVSADYDDCRLISESIPDLNAINISRLASSARPVGGRGDGGRGGQPGRPRLTLYENTNFGGRSMVIDTDVVSLADFTDRARSVRVSAGRWQLCERVRFGGRCVEVVGDVRNLDAVGLGQRVASVRLVSPR